MENSLRGWLLQPQQSPRESLFEAVAIFLSSQDPNVGLYTEFYLWQPRWPLQRARYCLQGSGNKELQITDLGDSQLPKATLVAFRKFRVEAFLSSPIKTVTEQGKFFHLHWWVSHKKKQVVKCAPSYDISLHSLALRAPDWLSRTGSPHNTQYSSSSPLPDAMN